MIQSGGALITPSSLGDEDHWPGAHRQFSYSGGSLALSGLHASYAHIYRAQLWVYVLVNKLARAEARLPLKTYDRGDQGRTEQRDHPYAVLLRQPNPRMNSFFLWLWTESTAAIYGEALWVKLRPAPGRPPMELWPWHPANVVIERDSDGTIWYSDMSNRARRYAETDVVHFSSYNPESTMRGLSPLEPLRMTLLNEDAARRATSSFWQRGARPGVALKHPGNLSKPAADRLKDQWDGLTAGADKTGASVVLEEGMTPETLTLTAEEAQYIETRKLNREEVCAAFDIPPPVVHILDRSTFNNITELMRSLYRDTMAPRLADREATLAAQLAPDFGPGTPYAEFLLDEVLRGDFEQRMAAYRSADFMTVAEKREKENLPFIEGTDRIFVNAATVPLDAMDTVLADKQGELRMAMRSVLGRLSRVKSLAEIDPHALTEGLNGDSGPVLAAYDAALLAGESVAELRERVKALGGPT